MSESLQNILVIKHGALGDIVIATAGFKAIREAFPDAHIVGMTGSGYATLLAQSPYFNEIWADRKPKITERHALKRLKTMLNSRPWDFVFDLQTSKRSTLYQWLFNRPRPPISNVSRFATHGYTDKARHTKHALENLRLQLAICGLEVGMPDVSWLVDDVSNLQPPGAYALLVPGGAAHREDKRWPAEQYAALAHELVQRGIVPLLIGTDAESVAIQSIANRVPKAVNLCGKTTIAQLATLAREAALAVGNDTGPMHVIAASNCPSTVIFSHASDPARSAPQGAAVTVLREQNLADLSVDRVLVTLPQ
jgi:ADP-heptose:LPS heptosyltransferase